MSQKHIRTHISSQLEEDVEENDGEGSSDEYVQQDSCEYGVFSKVIIVLLIRTGIGGFQLPIRRLVNVCFLTAPPNLS